MIKKCVKCEQLKEHHAKGMCYGCYRNLSWEPPKGHCKRCQRIMKLHAKELCRGCYNFIFNLDKAKAWNYKKWYGLDPITYKNLTKECVVCNFDKVVDLHHLDEDHKNNDLNNLIGLCPNHHKMLHDFRYRKEMRATLEQKGHKIPIDKKLDFVMAK